MVTLGSTQASVEQGFTIQKQLATVLLCDEEARTLYEKALKKLGVHGFSKKHDNLLGRYIRDLRKHCSTDLHLHAVRALRWARWGGTLTGLIMQWARPIESPELETENEYQNRRVHEQGDTSKAAFYTFKENTSDTPAPSKEGQVGEPASEESEDSDPDAPSLGEKEKSPLPFDSFDLLMEFLIKGLPFKAFKAQLRYLVSPPADISEAVSTCSIDLIEVFLEKRFSQAAVGEYVWISDLKTLGLSHGEIAKLLCSSSHDSPWIYFEPRLSPREFPMHIRVDHHMGGCPHRFREPNGTGRATDDSASHVVQDE
ncbi:hypothetical protein S40288_10444, partial [Stachybotrys chartarum IBT 40288]